MYALITCYMQMAYLGIYNIQLAAQVKSMACAAALALQADSAAERQRLLSAAKALTAQLARRCALDAIQLHGAMGMTDECVASRYARRLIGIGQWFGDASHHLQRFAAVQATAPG